MARPTRFVRRMRHVLMVLGSGMGVAGFPGLPGMAGVAGVGVARGQCDPVQSAKLVGSDTGGDDRFGTQVAIHGDIAVIGAPWDKFDGVEMGSAYVFVRGPGGWVQEAKLVSPDPQPYEWFGRSVAVYGDTAAVGATKHDLAEDAEAGCVYVFVRSGGVWAHRATLIGGDEDCAYLGISVAMSGGTIVAGAQMSDPGNEGAAYIFEGADDAWTLRAKLQDTSGEELLWFGGAVATDGDTVVIGSTRREIGGIATGAAYIYGRVAGGWALRQTVWAPDGASMDEFGCGVAVSGDTVIVGARYDDNERGTDAGSVYVFRGAGGTWGLEAKLLDDESSNAHFGTSVAVEGDIAIVGSPWKSKGGTLKTGALRVFTRTGAAWPIGPRVYATDAATTDEFGCSAAMSGGVAVVGAWYDSHPPYSGDAGSAYVFDMNCDCVADLTGDGLVDFSDYLEFLNLYEAGDLSVDFNGDGIVDFADYLEFLNFYDAGC
ncbi:MAG: hypothetical protein IT436_18970 [Phycisphaerales bacterium]|nr:hypothetical protein [Phycisphaerales bacterium]